MQDSERWIWPFELKDKLGEGGMGEVYRARYVVNDKHFAVKLVPKDVKDETILARFERELEVLKTLKHPNIIRCFGGVCKNKQRFYAMELVSGGTLDDRLHERGKLPWEQVVEYGVQICTALDYSHERGIVHRDLKPANFLIGENGRIKLGDFGLASLAAARRITADGMTAGTYHYMAPEQIRGNDVTPKTDLYGLGCVLFELLTGKPPFEGNSPAEILQKHIKDPPPRITVTATDCPQSLEQIVYDLLQKDAKDRPQDAADVGARLKRVTPTITVTRTRRAEDVKAGNRLVQDAKPKPASLLDTPPRVPASPARPLAIPSRHVVPLLVAALAVSCVMNVSLRFGGNAGGPAEAIWIQTLTNSRNVELQIASAEVLGRLAKDSKLAMNALTNELRTFSDDAESRPREVRLAVVQALVTAGSAAGGTTPQLIKVAKTDPDDAVRITARDAIPKIEAAAAPGRPWWHFLNATVLISAAAFCVWSWRRAASKP